MRGGARPGAGRPKGSTNLPKIGDYITEEEVKELVGMAKLYAKAGKTDLLRFILEQIFGKARQNIRLDGGEDDKPITMKYDEEQLARIAERFISSRGTKSAG